MDPWELEYLLANISHVDFASSKLPNILEMEELEVFQSQVRIMWLWLSHSTMQVMKAVSSSVAPLIGIVIVPAQYCQSMPFLKNYT